MNLLLFAGLARGSLPIARSSLQIRAQVFISSAAAIGGVFIGIIVYICLTKQ